MLLMYIYTSACNDAKKKSPVINQSNQSELAIYTGKYQMKRNGNNLFIAISSEAGELYLTSLWDNQKNAIKHLSGDNFIMLGNDWSVKFIRGKDKNITQVVVMGTDYWTKVKS